MGNVMISLNDDDEMLLRKLAQERHGGKKGALSGVVQEALHKLSQQDQKKQLGEFVQMLKTGLRFKYRMYKTRDEIYD